SSDLLSLGIDYMQVYLFGKPQPLIDTLNQIDPIRERALKMRAYISRRPAKH
ncbi:hypothetical protein, partial [Escherichia coli]|uniref:hypothetical protein n=1 Tax=Escherichia coli TaxID=562 RepID=UPI003B225655